jgi:ribosomal peptide maturation radical SAM protein 1
MRVALVSMPFGSVERPSLGLGLLQAGARRAGHEVTAYYFGFTFVECVGLDDYLWVGNDVPYTAFAGDWLFTEALHGPDADRDSAYIEEILQRTWRLSHADVGRLVRMRWWVEPYLERCLSAVAWDEVDVVGFTSTFQQNVASLALARRLAARHPHLTIVFGGANWEAEMGQELHRRYPFVDLVCSGEADVSFPAVLAAIGGGDPSGVAGVVYRTTGGSTVATGASAPIHDMDALALPDFDDWFDAFAACPAVADVTPLMLMETSRGCWWGAHSHCTFCGLNGGSMSYRSKSPERAFEELKAVVERYGTHRVGIVDNILDMRYFRTFLPRVATELPGLSLFYEVKASLTNAQIETLARAGVHEIQPGIESLNDHVLGLMRKGTSALKNVQLLKWCAEHGVTTDWNVLYGAPGETAADYEASRAVVAAIGHLQPPTACGPVRLDRFSPYHGDPATFGISNVRPMAPYRWLYPFDDDVLLRIAYYFEFDQPDGQKPDQYTAGLRAAIQTWQSQQRGSLSQVVSEADRVVVVDTRGGTFAQYPLSGWQAAVYLECDRVRPAAELLQLPALAGVAPRQLATFVNWCVERRLMMVQDRSCLSLAVRTPARHNVAGDRPRHGRRLALVAAGASGAGGRS